MRVGLGAWPVLWGVPAAAALLHYIVTSRTDTLPWLLEIGFALAVATVAALLPSRLLQASLIGLIAVLLASATAPLWLASTWDEGAPLGLLDVAAHWLPGSQSRGERFFALTPAAGDHTITVAFEAMAPEPERDTSWLRSHGTYVTTTVLDPEGAFTRVIAPDTEGAYLRKIFDLGATEGGVELRASWRMRFATVFETAPCRGVVLHAATDEVGRAGVRCAPVQPTSGWQTYEVAWRLPDAARDGRLNLDLRDLEGQAFDVRDVRVQTRTPAGWRDLGPAIPDAPYVSLTASGGNGPPVQVALRALAASRARADYRIDATVPGTATRLVVKVHPAAGTDAGVTTRVTSLVAFDDAGRRLPAVLPRDAWSRRQALLADHPNTAGHAAATAGIGAFSAAMAPSSLAAIGIAAVATVWATGSRAALGGLVLAMAVLIAARPYGPTRWRLAWAIATLVLVALLVVAAGGRLRTVDDGTVAVRSAIWRVSGEAFLSAPWTGMTPEERSARYRASPAIPVGAVVGHAHNLGLELASLYGVFGLAVAAWLAAGLVGLAWHWEGIRGLAILLPAALGQLVDVTLFSGGVLVPLVVALELARRRAAAAEKGAALPVEAGAR